MKTNKIIALGAGLMAAGTLNANATELFQSEEVTTCKVEMAELCCGYAMSKKQIRASRKLTKAYMKEAKKAERLAKKETQKNGVNLDATKK